MQDADELKNHHYRTRDGIKEWMRECGFDNYRDAMKSLRCERRTWFRWAEKGLPSGLYGDLVVRAMIDIRQKRSEPRVALVKGAMG